MINLGECLTLQVMPEVFRKDVQVQAASYALQKTMRMLMEKVDRSSVYAGIDLLPEPIVDLLADELRAQYYDESLPVGDKREAVKRALPWHKKAGTVSTVRELCEFRYGSSIVQEWFDYGGRPYTFRLEILGEDRLLSVGEIDSFIRAVKAVKNTRSLLEALIFHRKMESTVHSGIASLCWTRQVIVDFYVEQSEENLVSHSAGEVNETFRKQVVVDFGTTEKDIEQEVMSGMVLTVDRIQVITEG